MSRLRFRRESREQYSIDEGRLADQPTRKDARGYQKLAEWTAKHVIEPKVTPITIGVYGPWGSGKTSSLSMVTEHLESARVTPVWFHAWRYVRRLRIFGQRDKLGRLRAGGGQRRREFDQLFAFHSAAIKRRTSGYENLRKPNIAETREITIQVVDEPRVRIAGRQLSRLFQPALAEQVYRQ